MIDNEITQEERIKRKKLAVRITILAILLITLADARCTNKRITQAVYATERDYAIVHNSPDTSEVVRLIGKPHRAYWTLPKTPKERHFWDKY